MKSEIQDISLLVKYFPSLTSGQKEQFLSLSELFIEWNEKINLVSRKDVENLYERHILHSLGIAKIISFSPRSKIMDIGTGGGFPGLPLAILFPDVHFTLVDSIGKKIRAVEAIALGLKLENVSVLNARAEGVDLKFDFITGRAVTDLNIFYGWVRNKIKKEQQNALPNGILYLKGDPAQTELKPFGKRARIFPLSDFFEESFFETKSVIYIEAMP